MHIPSADGPPNEPKCTEPYYTKEAPHPPLIEPKCTDPYYSKPVEPIEK